MSEKEKRPEHLCNLVKRIVNGPDEGDIDQWANRVLADLPDILNAAMLAFDYEFGRVISGISRPIYHYGGRAYPTDEYPPEESQNWRGIGREARQSDAQIDKETRLLFLEELASRVLLESTHPIIRELADAISSLRLRDHHELFTPLPGNRRSQNVILARYSVAHVVRYRARALKTSLEESRADVAGWLGYKDGSTIQKWEQKLKKIYRGDYDDMVRYAEELGCEFRAENLEKINQSYVLRDNLGRRYLDKFSHPFKN